MNTCDKDKDKDKSASFFELSWDTDFFKVSCAKATLYKSLTEKEWQGLKEGFKNFQFIVIENQNSNPSNAYLIGTQSEAFLVDVNIQFSKKTETVSHSNDAVHIYQGMNYNGQVLKIANFPFSRFTDDVKLAQRDGGEVYRQWIVNSFNKENKFFALYENEEKEIEGFLLYSYSDNACIIELIAASGASAKKGIGTSLFKAVENEANRQRYNEIKVGTQLRNMPAINFYQKCGCKQVSCNQIYHLWNT